MFMTAHSQVSLDASGTCALEAYEIDNLAVNKGVSKWETCLVTSITRL